MAVDIAFVVDSSDNVTPDAWRNFLNFIKRTVDRFHVTPRSANVGMITYGRHPKVEFKFNSLPDDKLNNYEVKRLVDDATLQRGLPRTDLALKKAYTSLFSEESGMRRLVSKVCCH